MWTGHLLPILANYAQAASFLPLVAAVIGLYLQHQCHMRGCLRLAWHPHPGHGHPVCRKHHPHSPPRV